MSACRSLQERIISPEDQLTAFQQGHSLLDDAMNSCYRERGLFAHHAARAWATELVRSYKKEHHHSAIRFITPPQCYANLD